MLKESILFRTTCSGLYGMEILHYPLLCWQISEGYICGHLIDARYQLVEKSLKKIKSNLASQILRDAEENHSDPFSPLKKPRLKIFDIEIRPSYREKDGIYPVTNTISVPLCGVYGENDSGFYQCFLPTLGQSFFFYNEEQIQTMMEHFANNTFKQLPPEKIHRYIFQSKPWLEDVVVRYNARKRYVKKDSNEWIHSTEILRALGEQMPPPRSLQRKIGALPEAAWEQAETVQIVIEKILKESCNLLLVGNSGVGKSAIFLEALRKIQSSEKRQRPELRHCFWMTNPRRIVANAKYMGDWEKICDELIEDLLSVNGILWLTDFIDLFYIGGEGAEDSMAAFILSYLRRGNLQIIGEVSPQQLEIARNRLPGFVNHFQTLYIEEMEEKKVFSVLGHFGCYFDEKLGIKFEQTALELLYRLLNRFVKYHSFPGKAVSYLNFFSTKHIQKEKKSSGKKTL